jgi:two-component system sensor histidine kinase KdpD
LRPSKEWGTIHALFENVVDRCASDLSNHPATIHLGEELPMVKIDSRLTAEALSNLIENAAKYSPNGSEIVLDGTIQDGILRISVRDEGPGIRPDDLDHVFDKFYRGTHKFSKRVEGTGMGLAIAKGIVEAQGGKIWVQSTSDRGTTFAFSLPVETRQVSQLPASEEDRE